MLATGLSTSANGLYSSFLLSDFPAFIASLARLSSRVLASLLAASCLFLLCLSDSNDMTKRDSLPPPPSVVLSASPPWLLSHIAFPSPVLAELQVPSL